MNTCPKCKAEIPKGKIECQFCKAGLDADDDYVRIDWRKVNTVRDFQTIVLALGLVVKLNPGSEAYKILKEYC